jgi:uncharacterized membrane protein
MKTKVLYFISLMMWSMLSISQNTMQSEPQMADNFRSEGKIYIVITVISIIFICLVAYLVYIDLKLRKLEKKN